MTLEKKKKSDTRIEKKKKNIEKYICTAYYTEKINFAIKMMS